MSTRPNVNSRNQATEVAFDSIIRVCGELNRTFAASQYSHSEAITGVVRFRGRKSKGDSEWEWAVFDPAKVHVKSVAYNRGALPTQSSKRDAKPFPADGNNSICLGREILAPPRAIPEAILKDCHIARLTIARLTIARRSELR
jgi:hypothetical protein